MFFYSKSIIESDYEKELTNFASRMPAIAYVQDLSNKEKKQLSKAKIEELIKIQVDKGINKQSDPAFENLSQINLHNTGLTNLDIDPLKNLNFVKKLALSFNNLTYLKDCNLLVRYFLLVSIKSLYLFFN